MTSWTKILTTSGKTGLTFPRVSHRVQRRLIYTLFLVNGSQNFPQIKQTYEIVSNCSAVSQNCCSYRSVELVIKIAVLAGEPNLNPPPFPPHGDALILSSWLLEGSVLYFAWWQCESHCDSILPNFWWLTSFLRFRQNILFSGFVKLLFGNHVKVSGRAYKWDRSLKKIIKK